MSKMDSKNVDMKSMSSTGTKASLATAKQGSKTEKKAPCYIKPITDSVYKKAR